MRNYSIYTLKTKLEFTNLYQYLSEKDYKQLEQQILCHSYHTPICTWNGIVINGIEAYELFRKHSIPFRIKRLHFSSKEDVISWKHYGQGHKRQTEKRAADNKTG